VTLDLASGHATVVGATGFDAASLAVGPDSLLYAGGSLFDGGRLHRIDRVTASSIVVGATGFASVPGLTLVRAAPGSGVPATFTRSALAIHVANPIQGALRGRVTLPEAGPVRIEFVGIDGRRVCTRELGPLGPGLHAFALDD